MVDEGKYRDYKTSLTMTFEILALGKTHNYQGVASQMPDYVVCPSLELLPS